jgi:DNA-binding CsgD family transcriptional regulator
MGEGLEADTANGDESAEDDEWLIVATEANDAAVIESMMLAWRLTAREAEVLHWVARGKTNRDVGDILGASPRTVTKHMEHILQKLGVETRTAAAGLVLNRVGLGAARG